MNDLTLVRKNLFGKPLRTGLLVVSILVAFLIFAVLVSFNAALNSVKSEPNRLVTLNKVNFTETLPIAYYDRVRAIEGVAVATHMNWFGGYYQDQQRGFISTFAVDPESYLAVYAKDVPLTPTQRETFLKERTALLVDKSVADRFGWKDGQRIPLKSNLFTKPDGGRSWDFVIAGVYTSPPGGAQTGGAVFRYDYYNETVDFGRDRIGWIPLLTTSAEVNDRVIQAIDSRFANSGDETATQDEATFNKAFISQLGNIALVITVVVSAAFAAILLIVGNTMALAVRERTREVGVLKTLGFSSGRILRLVLGESLLLTVIGASLGVGLAALALTAMAAATQGAFGQLSLPPIVIAEALAIAVALGLLTGAFPALSAYRLRIIDALGRR